MPRDGRTGEGPVFDRFRAGLRDGGLPPGITSRDPAEAARRFAVYRNNVAHGLGRALARRFPAVERLVGAEFFAAMAAVFIDRHPPDSPLLFQWGAAMPGFLERFSPVSALAYLPDVARIELARGEAYHAADAVPLAPAQLAAAAGQAGGLWLALHPSVRIVRTRFSALTIWAAQQPGAASAGPLTADRDEGAVILRDPSDAVQVLPASPGDLALVQSLAGGGTLLAAAAAAALAEPGHAPGPILMTLVRHGALTAAREDTDA